MRSKDPGRRIARVAFGALLATLGVVFGASAAAPAGGPAFAFRADHMILDAAIHGSEILVGTQSGRVEVFDRHSGMALAGVSLLRVADGRITQRFSGHTAPLQSLLFADGGATLISAGRDARVLIWNLTQEGVLR